MDLSNPDGPTIYPGSPVEQEGTTYFLGRDDGDGTKRLGVRGDLTGFEGARDASSGVLRCALTKGNAAALRARLPWLRPVALGVHTSAGFRDRLGIATPGHVRADR